ncbi:hypothetical protein M404DRAFT_169763, partial [Pisolithus tinctorius Marx 270]
GHCVGFDAQSSGHHVYLKDHHMVIIKQNISFKKLEGPAFDPCSLQIEREKEKGQGSNQHADTEDHTTTDVPNPPPDLPSTREPLIMPDNTEAPSLTCRNICRLPQ